MPAKYYIGVDLGGTNIKAGIVTAGAKVVLKDSIPTEAAGGPQHVLSRAASLVESLIARSAVARGEIGGIGIGAPGTLDIKAGIVRRPPNLPGWNNVPVVAMIEKATGIRAVLENDANQAAYGEYWAGKSSRVSPLVVFTLGTGIGGGIIIDGKVLHGDTDSAAELGHMVIVADGRPCACGNWGCLEAYASAPNLARRFREAVEAGEESSLAEAVRSGAAVDSKTIYEAAAAGDALAKRIYEETGKYLGIGVVNALNIINPARVLLSGGMIHAGELLMRPVRETVEKRALPDARRKCEIAFADLGEDAGFIGGAGCALAAFGTSQ